MRVVTADPVGRRPRLPVATPRERHRAHVEALGLIATTLVIVLGIWLTYRQQLAEAAPDTDGAALVDLNHAAEAALVPALTAFATPAEREFAAHAVAARVSSRGPLTHVGALASISVPSAEVRADKRLTTLNARLGLQPQAT